METLNNPLFLCTKDTAIGQIFWPMVGLPTGASPNGNWLDYRNLSQVNRCLAFAVRKQYLDAGFQTVGFYAKTKDDIFKYFEDNVDWIQIYKFPSEPRFDYQLASIFARHCLSQRRIMQTVAPICDLILFDWLRGDYDRCQDHIFINCMLKISLKYQLLVTPVIEKYKRDNGKKLALHVLDATVLGLLLRYPPKTSDIPKPKTSWVYIKQLLKVMVNEERYNMPLSENLFLVFIGNAIFDTLGISRITPPANYTCSEFLDCIFKAVGNDTKTILWSGIFYDPDYQTWCGRTNKLMKALIESLGPSVVLRLFTEGRTSGKKSLRKHVQCEWIINEHITETLLFVRDELGKPSKFEKIAYEIGNLDAINGISDDFKTIEQGVQRAKVLFRHLTVLWKVAKQANGSYLDDLYHARDLLLKKFEPILLGILKLKKNVTMPLRNIVTKSFRNGEERIIMFVLENPELRKIILASKSFKFFMFTSAADTDMDSVMKFMINHKFADFTEEHGTSNHGIMILVKAIKRKSWDVVNCVTDEMKKKKMIPEDTFGSNIEKPNKRKISSEARSSPAKRRNTNVSI